MVRSLLQSWFRKIKSLVLGRTFGIIVASLIAFFLLMNYVVMPWYVYHGGTLAVPDLVGMQFEEAHAKLYEMGLVAIESDKILDNEHPIGSVVTQNPKPNSIVKYGRRIYLTVCGGEVLVPVPSLRGRSTRDARFALERNGLKVGEVVSVPSDSSPANTIISQAIAANERVKKGTAVGFTVSTGSTTKTIEVPNLFGKSLTEAEKILEYVGLKLGNVTYQINVELLPNTVVEQYPQAGAQLDSAKTVDLFVAKAGKVQDER